MRDYDKESPALTIAPAEGPTVVIAPAGEDGPEVWEFWEGDHELWKGGESGKATSTYFDCLLIVGRPAGSIEGRLVLFARSVTIVRERGNDRLQPRQFKVKADLPLPLFGRSRSVQLDVDFILPTPERLKPVAITRLRVAPTVGGQPVDSKDWCKTDGIFADLAVGGIVNLERAIERLLKPPANEPVIDFEANPIDVGWWNALGVEGLAAWRGERAILRWRRLGRPTQDFRLGLELRDYRPVAELKWTVNAGSIRTGRFGRNPGENDPVSSSRLAIDDGVKVTLRATPSLANANRTSTNQWIVPWRFECEFQCVDPTLVKTDPFELWNSRLANDLLRSVRPSFLPYFARPKGMASSAWLFVAIRPDIEREETYRLVIPQSSIMVQMVLHAAGHGLPAEAMRGLHVSAEHPEDGTQGRGVVDLEQSLLNPRAVPANALLIDEVDSKLLVKVAAIHGAMILRLTPDPGQESSITLDEAGFEVHTTVDPGGNGPSALAWISLAGQMLVDKAMSAPRDDEGSGFVEAMQWTPDHSHYAVRNLVLSVESVVPLPSSARARARTTDEIDNPTDTTRSLRSGSRVVLAPLRPDPKAPPASRLLVNERSRPLGGVELEASWQRVAGGTTDTPQVLIIQPQPLFVAMVAARIETLDSGGRETELGLYKDGAWSFRGTRDFIAALPPGCVGESTIRGSEMDPKTGAVERFRLSPPTLLALRSSEDPTGYAPSPWLLPELLNGGDNNQGAGAAVRSLSSELSYGLMMRVERPNLFVASVFRRRGWPVETWATAVQASRADVSASLASSVAREWQRVDELARSCGHAIELYDRNAARDDQLKIDSGVSWRLRRNARLADPFRDDKRELVDASRDVKGELVDIITGAEGLERAELNRALSWAEPARANRTVSKPLWGGVTIGFESKGVLTSFVDRAPLGSTGGSLTGFQHGPHGVTATFKSEFEDGLLAIECVVEQGVVTRQVVSRKGRFGCLWNRAKHVVVYERTAISNPRYTERTDDRKQRKQNGRAFLRKVDEYIELLEPQRSYPDRGASERFCGCIAGSDFGPVENAKFRVEASWARDVLDDTGAIVGWAIPIWLPTAEQIARGAAPNVKGADESRSSIHPKPAVSIMLRTERPDDRPDHQLIEDPEKLVFYMRTFTKDELLVADTDLWAPVVDVDYCDMIAPRPASSKRTLAAGDDEEHFDDQPDADEPEIEPGYEPFTLTLAPGARPANLTHARRAEALGAHLRTVLISRARMKLHDEVLADKSAAELLPALKRHHSLFTSLDLDDAKSTISTLISDTAAQTGGGSDIDKLITRLNKLRKELVPWDNPKDDPLAKIAKTAMDKLEKHKLAAPVSNAVKTASDELDARLTQLAKLLGSAEPSIDQLIDQALLQAWPSIVPFDRLRSLIDRTMATIRTVAANLIGVLEHARRNLDVIERTCNRLCEAAGTARDSVLARLDRLVQAAIADLAGLRDRLSVIKENARRTFERAGFAATEMGTLAGPAMNLVLAACDAALAALNQDLSKARDTVKAEARAAGDACTAGCAAIAKHVVAPVRDTIARARASIEYAVAWPGSLAPAIDARDPVEKARAAVQDAIASVLGTAKAAIGRATEALSNVSEINKELEETINAFRWEHLVSGDLRRVMDQWRRDVDGVVRKALGVLPDAKLEAFKARAQRLLGLKSKLDDAFEQHVRGAVGATHAADKRIEDLTSKVTTLLDNCQKELEYIKKGASTAADAAKQMRDHALAAARDLRDTGRAYADLATRAARAARGAAKGDIFAAVDGAMTLHRAFGEPPRVPGLDFNRRQLAYHFDRAKEAIRMTPVGAMLERAGDHLRGIGIRLPTDTFDGTFLPALREAMDLGKLFPDFAGLKLTHLFRGINLSSLRNDYVQVRHDVDPKTRTAAVWASVDYPLPSDATLVDEGVLAIILKNGKLTARTKLEIAEGVIRRESKGAISADWVVRFAGSEFVTFQGTTLEFDSDGRTKFDLRPDKVKLSGLLGFVSERLKSLTPDAGGPVEFLRDSLGLPRGIRVPIDIKIPDTQGGTTGFSGLRLGAWFMMALGDIAASTDPRAIKRAISEFEVGVGFSLAKPDRPFTLTAFILGGSGHLDVGLRYMPALRRLRAYVDVSMNASASLAFSVAGVSGGVYAYLGIVFRYEAATGSRPALVFAARLLITGEVDVWGIVSASISIELRLAYVAARRQLVAAGRLRIRIKICWCFTIKINVGFTIPAGVRDDELGMASRDLPNHDELLRRAECVRDIMLHTCALSV